jgi:hypothetical protein
VGSGAVAHLYSRWQVELELESVHGTFGSHGQRGRHFGFLQRAVACESELGRNAGVACEPRSDRKYERKRRGDDRQLRPA